MRALRSSLLVPLVVVPLVAMALAGIAGCTEEGPDRPRGDGGVPGDGGGGGTACTPGGPAAFCLGNQEVSCNPDGTEAGRRNCPDLGQVCAPDLGCAVCIPNRSTCDGDTVQRCRADGSGYDTVETCDAAAGETCNASAGVCTSPCADAAASNSYIGCEYWPVTSANAVDAAFDFAVVVSNPQSSSATVTVTRNGSAVGSPVTIAPGEIQSITLPWVDELKGGSENGSQLVRGGGYRLTSTLPVTVYQFSPLEYSSGADFSYSNDASLLLPSHVLTSNYLITTRPTHHIQQDALPGFGLWEDSASSAFFTVTATGEGSTTVEIRFNGDVLASASGGSVTAYSRGSSGSFTLNQGDVLQILSAHPATCASPDTVDEALYGVRYCRVTEQYDLTGTEVRASQPVAVTAGHECAFVPYNRWACDHLEEQLFPLEAWGTNAFVSITRSPQPETPEVNIVRIVSGRDGNALTFDPPSAHSPVTLNLGQSIEFEATTSFRVQGTEAIQVVQYLVGQDYAGIAASGEDGQGDPSMFLAIPADQFRTSYAFLAPTTYAQSYVNVTAPMGASVTLDGTPVGALTAIGSTGFGVARVPVSGGAHDIEGTEAFGIVVYGFGSYTSYAYPGGLDLEEINIPF